MHHHEQMLALQKTKKQHVSLMPLPELLYEKGLKFTCRFIFLLIQNKGACSAVHPPPWLPAP